MLSPPAQIPRSPDGERYWAMGAGAYQPLPFHLRWLLPWLCRQSVARWWWSARIAAVAVCLLAWAFTGAWAAALVPLGLAGVHRVHLHCLLVDLQAQALALAAATCAVHGWWPAAVALAVVAGTCRETAPVFAAAWAWNPVLLVGLIAPAVRMAVPHVRPSVRTSLAEAVSIHRRQPFLWFVLPWGVLVLGLAHPTLQLAVVLALAYGQLLIATDLVRLYQWAWPVLALRTFDNVPRGWWLVLVVLHLASPHQGEGF